MHERTALTAIAALVAFGVLCIGLMQCNPSIVHADLRFICTTGENKIADADSIFSGTVTAIDQVSGAERVRGLLTFDVHRVWRGKNRTIHTITGHWSHDRIYRAIVPVVGETYLVYAYISSGKQTRYYTNFLCGDNLWHTGQNYINPYGDNVESILSNDLEILGPGRPAGQPSTFGVVLVVLHAAFFFVIAARVLLLWRWPRRKSS